jgi:hypothetical protein
MAKSKSTKTTGKKSARKAKGTKSAAPKAAGKKTAPRAKGMKSASPNAAQARAGGSPTKKASPKKRKMRTIKDSYKTGTITRKQAHDAVVAAMKIIKEREREAGSADR